MTGPTQRRTDPQPLGQGWELPFIAVTGAALGAALAALAGLGVAAALFGGGWVWPHATTTVGHVLGGILRGRPGRGLPPDQAAVVAGPAASYAAIALAELLLVAVLLFGGVAAARYRRPTDPRSGMASRREAADALGLGPLRAARTIIRPDRYPPPAPARPRRR